jgi:hypothetical protein
MRLCAWQSEVYQYKPGLTQISIDYPETVATREQVFEVVHTAAHSEMWVTRPGGEPVSVQDKAKL